VSAEDLVADAGQQALFTLLLAFAPLAVPALIAGLVVGILQAATSINDATLSFVPKLAVVIGGMLVFGGLIAAVLVTFAKDMFGAAAAL
jgi:flagellar biosynthetic protein FliQ